MTGSIIPSDPPATASYHDVDGPGLIALATDLADGYEQLRTPWRPKPEARVMRPALGPRTPIPVSILDAEIAVQRTVVPLCEELAKAAGLLPPAAHPVTCCRWLVSHAEELRWYLHPGDIFDLEILRDQCRRLAGLPSPELEADARRAEMQRQLGTGTPVWGSSRKIASLAAAAGCSVSHMTVVRWAEAGHVTYRDDAVRSGRVEYLLSDVLDEHARRAEEAAA
ncbi:hypothetical protein PQI66_00270 [Corynebacterium sp. USCH3]|uniref:hypothetical protein n=1 Tax=Corynebacterium sp. USCH3 TaxID=3024840 RepID=UPI0030957166